MDSVWFVARERPFVAGLPAILGRSEAEQRSVRQVAQRRLQRVSEADNVSLVTIGVLGEVIDLQQSIQDTAFAITERHARREVLERRVVERENETLEPAAALAGHI